jgi:hypothetical protein
MSGIEGTWSFGFIIGLIVVAVLLAICGIVALVGLAWRTHADSYDKGAALATAIGGFVAAVLVAGVTACATFPWESAYHRYEPKVGEVQAIDKRLVPSGEGMEEKMVVRFANVPGQWGCEDTRCALVKPGDNLALRCIKRWDYSATDGYDCRFVAHEAKS